MVDYVKDERVQESARKKILNIIEKAFLVVKQFSISLSLILNAPLRSTPLFSATSLSAST
jgi:hypothetical protein